MNRGTDGDARRFRFIAENGISVSESDDECMWVVTSPDDETSQKGIILRYAIDDLMRAMGFEPPPEEGPDDE